MIDNVHHSLLGGLATDTQLLDQLVEMAAESAEIENFRDAHSTEKVVRVAREYDAALAAAIDELVDKYPPIEQQGADDVWSAEAPYLVLMTLEGQGVGIWDGSWDHLYSRERLKDVRKFLERRLHRFADSSGAGKLEDAFLKAAFETTGAEGYAMNRIPQNALAANQASAAPWIVGGLLAAGLVYLATRPAKAATKQPAATGPLPPPPAPINVPEPTTPQVPLPAPQPALPAPPAPTPSTPMTPTPVSQHELCGSGILPYQPQGSPDTYFASFRRATIWAKDGQSATIAYESSTYLPMYVRNIALSYGDFAKQVQDTILAAPADKYFWGLEMWVWNGQSWCMDAVSSNWGMPPSTVQGPRRALGHPALAFVI